MQEDNEQMFQKFMEFMKNSGKLGKQYPTTQNPTKYPRAIKLEGDKASELLLKLTELKMKQREMDSLVDSMHIIFHDSESLRGRFFKLAEQTYPDIKHTTYGNGGEGWREWKGDFWYVSWDDPDDDEAGGGEKV